MMRGMVIEMNDEQLHTLAQLRGFLDGTLGGTRPSVLSYCPRGETAFD
jgi:hypothetical protein